MTGIVSLLPFKQPLNKNAFGFTPRIRDCLSITRKVAAFKAVHFAARSIKRQSS